MKAILSQHNFRGNICSMNLDIKLDSNRLNCACIDITNIDEISTTISNLRRMAHNRLDALIDTATADFMKGKFKNIY